MKSWMTAAAALAVVAGCAAPVAVPTQGGTGRAFSTPVPGVPGIDNFSRLTPVISRGGQPDKEGLRYLKAQGYRTVINFRSHHSEKKDAEALGMKAVEIPIQADIFGSTPPTEEQIRDFFRILLDPAGQPVFFHCALGKDRTGTMAALYRIEVDGWTPEEAVEEMMAFGFHTVYKDLVAFVRGYRPRGYGKPAPPGK